MSGIEVAGLILGAIPILTEGLQTYRKSLKAVKPAFEKRKTIDSLLRALSRQATILEELLKSVLIESGCEIPSSFPAGIEQILTDSETQEAVKDYLGSKHDIFIFTLEDCDEIFHRLALKIAKLVPSVKDSVELSKLIEANKNTKKGQLDLVARMSLVLKIKSFDEDCEKLDAVLHSLQRLCQLISSNHHLSGQQSSGKTKRLAKAFWNIRKRAEDLYLAVSKGWVFDCHRKHEARLILEDRVEELTELQKRPRNEQLPVYVFQLLLSGQAPQQENFWHESTVQAFHVADEDARQPLRSDGPQATKPRVTIIAPAPELPQRSMKDIKDICSAIEEARKNQEHIIFALTKDCRMATGPTRMAGFKSSKARDGIRLKDLLQNHSQSTRKALSWRIKTSLALNVASNFLQLLRTPWALPRLSSDTVSFLQNPNQEADIRKPFLSLSFEQSTAGPAVSNTAFRVKEALLNLGVMLLEIWHEKTLEDHFPLSSGSMRVYELQVHALEWLESDPHALPNSYHQAVFHCVAGAMNCVPCPKDWDDMRLWETVFQCVIEPLYKISKS
ncbi:uncharacterized protein Z518_09695 [Rhinocladiella mackenziei CBS 650.93]|uniref:DUF7580 domain-containing protein n=1 Tax=Rhinocladiella mackenziei CBS 650.93 TaxID=1442369 RepID=A0A0D2IVA1_9EURO|nr:uncharacterized protein Z518_09695 [Rhinocladiella mackenziei CBS 650.93]KIX00630.1 hypothetical protein Z518_09695 [Rhinocladiella mackenziei CBS 650.93]